MHSMLACPLSMCSTVCFCLWFLLFPWGFKPSWCPLKWKQKYPFTTRYRMLWILFVILVGLAGLTLCNRSWSTACNLGCTVLPAIGGYILCQFFSKHLMILWKQTQFNLIPVLTKLQLQCMWLAQTDSFCDSKNQVVWFEAKRVIEFHEYTTQMLHLFAPHTDATIMLCLWIHKHCKNF
jgi:hypothetical protein